MERGHSGWQLRRQAGGEARQAGAAWHREPLGVRSSEWCMSPRDLPQELLAAPEPESRSEGLDCLVLGLLRHLGDRRPWNPVRERGNTSSPGGGKTYFNQRFSNLSRHQSALEGWLEHPAEPSSLPRGPRISSEFSALLTPAAFFFDF